MATTVRCAAVWTTATAAATGLVSCLLTVLADAPTTLGDPHASFDRLLALVCAGVGLPAVLWLWLLATIVVGEALGGAPRPVPGMPGAVRRAILAACGVAVLASTGAPGHAQPAEPHRDRPPQTAAAVIAGLPLPDRAVGRPGPHPEVVEVRPGDTLWELARRDLGRGADEATVAARWREIYALNRTVIGADPDLIQPAQRLRLPAG